MQIHIEDDCKTTKLVHSTPVKTDLVFSKSHNLMLMRKVVRREATKRAHGFLYLYVITMHIVIINEMRK